MNAGDKLQARTDFAREMGAKAEALRVAVLNEAHRCEGAVGALNQAAEVLRGRQLALRDAFAAQEVDEVHARAAMDALGAAVGEVEALKASAEAQHNQQRGKAMQAELTMDMLQAAFDAEVAAAQRAAEPVDEATLDADPTARQPGHPGAGLAAERRVEEG